ncbi:MAG: LEPR-XLL domain-containing protein, partial [candidate division NC10 bacterium]|nr:LEPR-XLL domain-containing protein [candidate division NC10 bacterium]
MEPRILLSGDGLGHDDLTPLLAQSLLEPEPVCREAEADALQVSLALDDSQFQQPAARAPQLDGLQLTDPDTSCFQGQVFWLDFQGAGDVTYKGPITVGPFDVPAFRAPEPFSGQEAEIASEVTTSLNDLFAGTGVEFVARPPLDGLEFSTLYIGGDGAAFSDYGTFNGLTEQVDYGNQDRADNAFIFPQNVSSDRIDLDAYLADLSQVIAHEAGHLLGYDHTGGGEEAGSLFGVADTYDLSGQYCTEWGPEAWGQTIWVKSQIKNSGTGTVTSPFYVQYWLSNDQTFGDADDLLLYTYDHEADVPAGGYGPEYTVSFALPSTVPSGYPENGTVY